MASIWPANTLTGGGFGALDAIDGALLSDGDGALVIEGSNVYFYSLNATSGVTESSPGIIIPDTNAGDKRWVLQNISGGNVGATTGIQMNKSSITSDITIPEGYNALSIGPLDIDAEITIESNWEVI